MCARTEVLGCLLGSADVGMSVLRRPGPRACLQGCAPYQGVGGGQRPSVGWDVCLLALAREYQPSAEVVVVVPELRERSCESGADVRPFPHLMTCVLRSSQCVRHGDCFQKKASHLLPRAGNLSCFE